MIVLNATLLLISDLLDNTQNPNTMFEFLDIIV